LESLACGRRFSRNRARPLDAGPVPGDCPGLMNANSPAAAEPVTPSTPPRAVGGGMTGKPLAVFVLLCLIWGSTWLFIKVGLNDLPPFNFAGVRFVIAAAALLVVNAVRRVPLTPRTGGEWSLVALTGVLTFTINYGLLFWGEQHISSGLAALLQATIPAFGLVIAHYWLPGERLTWPKVIGVALGLTGVGVIFSDQLAFGPSALWGSAALVLGSLSVAFANVLIKARLGRLDPAMMASWQMIFGLLPLLLLGWLTEGSPLHLRWTPKALFCMLYLALVGSSLAFFLVYWLVRRMDVTKTLLISLVTPVVAVTIDNLALGETLSWRTAIGGACVLSGVAMVVIRRAKTSGPTPMPPASAEAVSL
jgi:drug/metabolite transporter (DMT)-like permease